MKRVIRMGSVIAVAASVLAASAAGAQESARVAVEGHAGRAWFADEGAIRHDVVAVGVRGYFTPRLAAGPELTYMRGPGIDRDWVLTGNLTFDVLDTHTRFRRVVPYLLVGGGYTHVRLAVGTGPYTYEEGAVTGGGGVRMSSRSGWYVAPEFRLGWELHARAGVTIGWSGR